MRYKLIIFDIDGTITRHISSWRYIHERLGIWDALAEKYQEKFLAGRISYRKFCELDAAHWKGMRVKMLEDVFSEIKYAKNVKHSIKMLKKTKLSLNYTMFSTKGMRNDAILSIPEMREVGIGKLMLEEGMITQEELDAYMFKFAEREEEAAAEDDD